MRFVHLVPVLCRCHFPGVRQCTKMVPCLCVILIYPAYHTCYSNPRLSVPLLNIMQLLLVFTVISTLYFRYWKSLGVYQSSLAECIFVSWSLWKCLGVVRPESWSGKIAELTGLRQWQFQHTRETRQRICNIIRELGTTQGESGNTANKHWRNCNCI